MKRSSILALFILFLARPGFADKGPIIWQDNVTLTQQSQKAIIAHNGVEEALILGTETLGSRDADILEFIPFPSEPAVSKAADDAFPLAAQLIAQKGLVFSRSDAGAVKGGRGSGAAMVPVEILVSQKIGLHDVTVVKINNVGEFRKWCEGFFRAKGIEADHERLSAVYDNARDYAQRGYTYFVFDQVKVSGELRFIEPLLYRFKTGVLYYPLKTSNLIGKRGSVELILLLPGYLMSDVWQNIRGVFDMSQGTALELSSSAKVLGSELRPIGFSSFFSPGTKIYMQVLKYTGAYSFKDDLSYSMGKLKPYAYRFESTQWHGQNKEFIPGFTSAEVRDLREYFCPKSGDLNYMFEMIDYVLDCWSFIPNEDYEIYAAIFRNPPSGLPRRDVVLGNRTIKNELTGTKLKFDRFLIKDFNEKNKISLPLEIAFPDDERLSIALEDDKAVKFLPGTGKTYVSRIGFDQKRSTALVYVDHVAGPRSGAFYYVTVRRMDGKWVIKDYLMAGVH